MYQPTFQLRVREFNPFGVNLYQLLLCQPNTNSILIAIAEAPTYADCKLAAGSIFSAAGTLVWNDSLMQTDEFYDFTTMALAT